MEADGLTVDLMKMKLGKSVEIQKKCDQRLRFLSLCFDELLAINEQRSLLSMEIRHH